MLRFVIRAPELQVFLPDAKLERSQVKHSSAGATPDHVQLQLRRTAQTQRSRLGEPISSWRNGVAYHSAGCAMERAALGWLGKGPPSSDGHISRAASPEVSGTAPPPPVRPAPGSGDIDPLIDCTPMLLLSSPSTALRAFYTPFALAVGSSCTMRSPRGGAGSTPQGWSAGQC